MKADLAFFTKLYLEELKEGRLRVCPENASAIEILALDKESEQVALAIKS